MIVQTGMRTDIPAFYAPWFLRRLAEGFVLVRNPYNHHAVTRFALDPEVVDMLVFCTKHPGPLLERAQAREAGQAPHMPALAPFNQYWFVTITPYGRDLEPNVPPWQDVAAQCRQLADAVGPEQLAWRYDPIVLTPQYDVAFHMDAFTAMARALHGLTRVCVISFIDLYAKVRRNFPAARAVELAAQEQLAQHFVRVGQQYGLTIRACAEGEHLARFGVDCGGCMTLAVYEQTLGRRLALPKGLSRARKECACVMGNDIGAYNSCPHLCRYCYANANVALVRANVARHDPASPFLIGGFEEGDDVRDARQASWLENTGADKPEQLRLI